MFRKGSPRHVLAGKVFVAAIMALSVSGAIMGAIKHQTPNVLAGTLTFYLVATAWAAARRGEHETRAFDWGALLVVLAVGAVTVVLGLEAARNPAGLAGGAPVAAYFVFSFLAWMSATGDVWMLVGGGVSGLQRIGRHLWRMCVALMIAAFSFFPGQVKLFPASVRAIKVLYLPHLLLVAALFYWILRVRFGGEYRRRKAVAVDVA